MKKWGWMKPQILKGVQGPTQPPGDLALTDQHPGKSEEILSEVWFTGRSPWLKLSLILDLFTFRGKLTFPLSVVRQRQGQAHGQRGNPDALEN